MSIGYATARNLSKRPNNLSTQASYRTLALTNPTIGFTAQGSATTQTGTKKFGTASMLAGGTGGGSYLLNTSGDYAWWPSGTGDFTVEWWQYIPSSVSGGYMEFASNEETSGGFGFRLGANYGAANFNAINVFARGQADLDYWNITWTRDTWQYVSITRASATMYCHVDGTIQTRSGSGAGSRNFVATSGLNKIQIGSAGGGGLRNVYVDDFRVSKTTARYGSGNYTAPASEGVLETGTTCLLNMNGSNGGTSFPNVTS